MVAAAFAFGAGTGSSALAQSAPVPPPVFQTLDTRDVELASGRLMLKVGSISIGPDGPGGLSFSWGVDSTMDSDYLLSGGFATHGSQFSVVFRQNRETFTFSGSAANAVFTQDQGRGATLSYNASANQFTYVSAEGMTAVFDTPTGTTYVLRSITYPAGEKLTYYYGSTFRTVTSSLGYQLRLGLTNISGTWAITSAVAFNMADETCDPTAASCTLAGTWPSLSRNFTTGVSTDSIGRQTQVMSNSGATSYSITYPTGRTVAYGGSYVYQGGAYYFKVTSFSDGAGSWTYQYPSPYSLSTLVFGPGNPAPEQYQFNSAGRLSFYHSADYTSTGIEKTYGFDAQNRITSSSVNGTLLYQYTYDARGNLTQSRQISTTPGTPADIVATAYYPPSCANPKTCNKPEYTLDPKGSRTDYSYVPATGQLESVTAPPATAGGTRPKATYTYGSFQAYYRNAAGSIVASGMPVSLPTAISRCMVGSACSGSANEARTTLAYGPQSAGTANNLLPVSITEMAGDSSLIATTGYGYNRTGDVATIDGPLAGTADISRTYYDAMRQPTGAIGPDPDGAGAALYSAAKVTYNGEGQPTKQEVGTATNQSDTGMTTFVSAREVNTTYNAQGRMATRNSASGGSVAALTQYSYLANGLPECTAQRMNPATYGALPASACTLATSASFGPDRIVKQDFDKTFRPTNVTTGLGTVDQSVEETRAYDSLGRLSTLTDAENNKTTYVYDGMSRVFQTRFPGLAKGSATSSTTDYEQLGYDVNGNVTSFRTRAGETLNMAYDNLNRLTVKDVPYRASMPTHTRDVYFGYDLLGNMMFAKFDGPESWREGIANAFNALGQLTSTTLNMDSATRTLSYTYDAAGNRLWLVYPEGGNYANYNRTSSGALYYADINNSLPLFYPPYDAAGRVSTLYRWNNAAWTWGASTGFQYDAVSRLSSLTEDPAGSSYDSTTSFTYNPASQIAGQTRSNDVYAWTGTVSVNRGYTANGLNQYTAVGGTGFGYDANGNLTSDGTNTYTYDVENRLVGRSGAGTSATLRYDPLGRLYETWGSTTQTLRYLYDGDDLVAEYADGGALLRRYVHGPGGGGDDPLVWFEGSTVGGSAMRHLLADERGSIVAVTDANGTVTNVNTYDEYGIPGAGNTGRFQYTGQAWIPEMGMYYYKARMYSPTLGRFMQTDPIGYGDGMNMYAYVRNDPLNGADPSGRCQKLTTSITWTPLLGDGRSGYSYGATQLIDSNTTLQGCEGLGESAYRGDPGRDIHPENINYSDDMVGDRYYGPTLCSGATYGRRNKYFSDGRVNTGRSGGSIRAGIDLEVVATLNGLTPPSQVNYSTELGSASRWSPVPIHLGGGWYRSYNYGSNQYILQNSGFVLRWSDDSGVMRLDIPTGALLPNGQRSEYNETCHYTR